MLLMYKTFTLLLFLWFLFGFSQKARAESLRARHQLVLDLAREPNVRPTTDTQAIPYFLPQEKPAPAYSDWKTRAECTALYLIRKGYTQKKHRSTIDASDHYSQRLLPAFLQHARKQLEEGKLSTAGYLAKTQMLGAVVPFEQAMYLDLIARTLPDGYLDFNGLTSDQMQERLEALETTYMEETLKKVVSALQKKVDEKQRPLTAEAAILAVMPAFGNDPMKAYAAIAAASDYETRKTGATAKSRSTPDVLQARSKSILPKLIMPAGKNHDPNPAGTNYHFWGYGAKRMFSGRSFEAIAQPVSTLYEADDAPQWEADGAGLTYGKTMEAMFKDAANFNPQTAQAAYDKRGCRAWYQEFAR